MGIIALFGIVIPKNDGITDFQAFIEKSVKVDTAESVADNQTIGQTPMGNKR